MCSPSEAFFVAPNNGRQSLRRALLAGLDPMELHRLVARLATSVRKAHDHDCKALEWCDNWVRNISG